MFKKLLKIKFFKTILKILNRRKYINNIFFGFYYFFILKKKILKKFAKNIR